MASSTVAGPGRVLSLTPTCEASSLDANDVIFATEEIPAAFLRHGGQLLLTSVTVLDFADQGQAIDLVFLDSDVAVGTEDAAVSITDANAAKVLGVVSITTSDYADHIANQVATVRNVGLLMQADGSSTSLYVAGVTRSGTPTYGASGLTIKLGVLWLA